jgi:antitoxin (DNA-binding transcriptional repressor) of toxin-antitoxin stability system
MVSENLTEAELAERLDDVLERVPHGEQFKIGRDGEVIAIMSPAARPLGITAEELIARLGNLKLPGDGFADDLEAIQEAQGFPRIDDWEDDDGNR